MGDEQQQTPPAPPQPPARSPGAQTPPQAPQAPHPQDVAAGPAALQALAAERDARRSAEARSKELESTMGGLKQGLLRQAVMAAASGKMNDPKDAMLLIDTSDLVVGDDGKIDEAKILQRIEDLVKAKPYLAVNGTRPPALPGGGAQPSGASSGQGFNEILRAHIGGG